MTDSRSRLSEAADENRQLREREKQLQLQLEQQAEQLEQQCNAGGGRFGTMEALMRAVVPQAELDELSSKANFDIFNNNNNNNKPVAMVVAAGACPSSGACMLEFSGRGGAYRRHTSVRARPRANSPLPPPSH